jgi:hypothetical protein
LKFPFRDAHPEVMGTYASHNTDRG